MTRSLAWIFLSVALFAGCSKHPRLLNYLELPPPENVTARFAGDSLIVQWSPISVPAKSKAKLFWYRIYLSRKSLMFVPVGDLPAPAAVFPMNRRSVVLRRLPRGEEWFLHVRSSNEMGDLSLPSLPEVHLVRGENGR